MTVLTETSLMGATEGVKDLLGLQLIIMGKHGSQNMRQDLFRLHRSGSWKQAVMEVLRLSSVPLIVWAPRL